MYRFFLKETFPCSPAEIMERSTQGFDDFTKYMPNVTRAEMISRRELDHGREEIVVEFHAESMVPAVARPFLNGGDISWKETFILDPERMTVDWKVETPVMTEYVDCGGVSNCLARGDGCELVIDGVMTIRVPDEPGLAKAAASLLVRALEPFIGKMVTHNLKKYFRALKKAMKAERRCG